MSFLHPNSLKDFLYHLGTVIVLGALILITFFHGYLPSYTRHGQTISVPEVEGKSMDEMKKIINENGLEFEIYDSTYTEKKEPLHIVSQFPKPGTQVKKGRKIYVTYNSKEPPEVRMPDLTENMSLKNARLVMENKKLTLDSVIREPSPYPNAVLEQLYKGKKIEPGTRIPRGAEISLVVGQAASEDAIRVPDVVGIHIDSAKKKLKDEGLQIGQIKYKKQVGVKDFVIRQDPRPRERVQKKTTVNLFISKGTAGNN